MKRKQRYEYDVIEVKPPHYGCVEASTIDNVVDDFAKDGWELKFMCLNNKSGGVMLTFERYHDEYRAYNDEIKDFLKDKKSKFK